MSNERQKGSILGLLPLAVFLILFIGSGIISGDFYSMPTLVAFIISTVVAFIFNRNLDFNTKMEIFCKGGGNKDIILMIMIFLFAGAFSGVSKAMGGADSVVNLGLSILPPNLLVTGLFIIGCFISISMGTSVGTIAAIGPIGVSVASKTGIPIALVLGAVVGGAMFGDNLSMISDTTIAATRTQGCKMRDKFKVNLIIVLPAAIATIILLTIMSSGYVSILNEIYNYELIKVLPYIFVLIGAVLGGNVFLLLGGGIIFSGVIGIIKGSLDIFGIITAISEGMSGMFELCMISVVVGGMVELIKFNGGIDFVLNFIQSKIKNKKGAEFGIAALVSIVDLCTANNTIAIVMSGPLAKNIADEYSIDAKKSASILDIFSSVWQGIIPYGAQLLTAAGLGGISPFEIIKYLHYPILMFICGIVAIAIGVPMDKTNKKTLEKIV